jgi:hypothetical protein
MAFLALAFEFKVVRGEFTRAEQLFEIKRQQGGRAEQQQGQWYQFFHWLSKDEPR